MDASLVPLTVVLIAVAFFALMAAGRGEILKGSNAEVANGAVLLTLAVIVGVLALTAALPRAVA